MDPVPPNPDLRAGAGYTRSRRLRSWHIGLQKKSIIDTCGRIGFGTPVQKPARAAMSCMANARTHISSCLARKSAAQVPASARKIFHRMRVPSAEYACPSPLTSGIHEHRSRVEARSFVLCLRAYESITCKLP